MNLTRGKLLAQRAEVAETPGTRKRGLLGTDSLPDGGGLLIVPCRQVHTFGMRYPIDVVFVDASWKVKRVVQAMRPGRLGALVLSSRAVLELPAGTAEATGTAQGDLLDALPIKYPVIDHVNRYVADVEKHISFYTAALGYELIDRGEKPDGSDYAILKGHEHELYISENPCGRRLETAVRHIGYAVEDADALLEELKENGIVDGDAEIVVKEYSRQFYLKDPDGNEIDVIQWTGKERFYRDMPRGDR